MSIYDTLNDKQKEAVLHTEGPLLILAGAGSGKTRVLTHRVAYLIDEAGVNPWNILAITFTNKAAGEMRNRVDRLVGFGSESVWVSTFHSMCVRILRRYIDVLGYDHNFAIYDTDDQKTMMKDVCKYLKLDPKRYKERMLLSVISSAKNEMITPERYRMEAAGDYMKEKIADVYAEYEKQMRANNALDFDDLLLRTVQLFEKDEQVLANYQERFRYIMVDEYQDTNTVQFALVKLLAGRYRNLCVVGDDDQSIYKFRGANIRNILNFEQYFPDAKVVKLEQNYRSTGKILQAANAVIRNNVGRKSKTLWTANDEGEKIEFRQLETSYDEADYVVKDIRSHVNQGTCTYNDNAILYRTNAQSRAFEERLVTMGIPYKIVGAIHFYARREIKDILAYLKTIDNGKDDLAVRRIINVPKRGIGLTSINRVQDYAISQGLGFYEALLGVDLIPGIGRAASKLESFMALIEHFKVEAKNLSITDLTKLILEETGYVESLKAEDEIEAEGRIENIDELLGKIAAYEENCEDMGEPATLSGFLEEVALVADIDSLEDETDYVVLMTLHSAKGLEFPRVYLTGMEDGVFPSYMTIVSESAEEMEEERRLCYVGITRAEQELTLTCARRRMIRGETQYNRISRFVTEIPPELLTTGELFVKQRERERRAAFERGDISFAGDPSGFGRGGSFGASAGFGSIGSTGSFGTPAAFGGSGSFGRAGKDSGNVQSGGKKRSNAYQAYAALTKGSELKSNMEGGPGYAEGDRVRHMKFGEGTVLAIRNGGRDFEVTVAFDTFGQKKMFATFAKLVKINR